MVENTAPCHEKVIQGSPQKNVWHGQHLGLGMCQDIVGNVVQASWNESGSQKGVGTGRVGNKILRQIEKEQIIIPLQTQIYVDNQ